MATVHRVIGAVTAALLVVGGTAADPTLGPASATDLTAPTAAMTGEQAWAVVTDALRRSDATLRDLGGTWNYDAGAKGYDTTYDLTVAPGGSVMFEKHWAEEDHWDGTGPKRQWGVVSRGRASAYTPLPRFPAGLYPTLRGMRWMTVPADEAFVGLPDLADTLRWLAPPPLTTTVDITYPEGIPGAQRLSWFTPTYPDAADPTTHGDTVSVTVAPAPDGRGLVVWALSQSNVLPMGVCCPGRTVESLTYGDPVLDVPDTWSRSVPKSYGRAALAALSVTREASRAAAETAGVGRRYATTHSPAKTVAKLRATARDSLNTWDSFEAIEACEITDVPGGVQILDPNRYSGRHSTWTITAERGSVRVARSAVPSRVVPLP